MEGARPATAEDVGRLAELYRQSRDELSAFRGAELLFEREARRQPPEGSLAAAVDSPDRAVWAGTIEEVVVGYGVGRIDRLATGDRLGVIEDLYVEPDARSVGVGEAMTDAMLAWFAGEGCRGVDALALPGARATKNFFEESGFTARLLVMHRRLDVADGPGGGPVDHE